MRAGWLLVALGLVGCGRTTLDGAVVGVGGATAGASGNVGGRAGFGGLGAQGGTGGEGAGATASGGSPNPHPNPNVDFYFIGQQVEGSIDSPQCIFAYRFGEPPEEVFCTPFTIEAAHGPSSQWYGLALVASADVPDLFPQFLYRLDLGTGELQAVAEVGRSLLSGTWEFVHQVFTPDAASTLLSRSTNTQSGPHDLIRVEGSGGATLPIIERQTSRFSIVGQLQDGSVIVDVPGDKVAFALAPEGDLMPFGQEEDRVVAISPDRWQVLAAGLGQGGQPRLRVYRRESSEPVSQLETGALPAGWIDDRRVLATWGGAYAIWTVDASAPVKVLPAPDYEHTGEQLSAKPFVAFRAGLAGAAGIGWLIDDRFAPVCGPVDSVRTLELPRERTLPRVIFDDAELNDLGAGMGAIYSCKPGETPVELLAPHGLHGRLLSKAPSH